MIRYAHIATLVLAAWPAPARAAPAAARYAIVVANNGSVAPGVPPLSYADDDAVMYLRLFEGLADGVELLTVLDDDSQRRYPDIAAQSLAPTRQAVRAALQRVYDEVRRRQEPSEIFFIYVGHGSLDAEGAGYVHLADGRLTRADLLHDVIAASPASYTHVIIDACNAYALVAGRGEKNAGEAETILNDFDRFLGGHDLADYPSVGVLAATSDNREAHEWSRIRAGLFSFLLRSALVGGADINLDGQIEYSEVAAFIDAASSELVSSGRRTGVFAWPPQRDRHAVLFDLRAPGRRHVVLDGAVFGRVYLESAVGDRWAEINKPAGTRVVLGLPPGTDFYLRGPRGEVMLSRREALAHITRPPSEPSALAERGAMQVALESSLFVVPFDQAYYRGYMTGRSHLLAVTPTSVTLADGLLAQNGPQQGARLQAGYAVGSGMLVDGIEHAVYARWFLPFHGALGFVVSADLGHTAVASGAHGVERGALAAGVTWFQALGAGWQVQTALEAGGAAVWISGSGSSFDATIPMLRMRTGVELALTPAFRLHAAGSAVAYRLTVNDQETERLEPRFELGLGW